MRTAGRLGDVQRGVEGRDGADVLRPRAGKVQREGAAGRVTDGGDARRVDCDAVGGEEHGGQLVADPAEAFRRVEEGAVARVDLGAQPVVGDHGHGVVGRCQVRDLREGHDVGGTDEVAAHVQDHNLEKVSWGGIRERKEGRKRGKGRTDWPRRGRLGRVRSMVVVGPANLGREWVAIDVGRVGDILGMHVGQVDV